MTTCGPGGSGTESCCASLEVTGGSYYRTYNVDQSTSGIPAGGWPDLADPATVSGYRLDRYLVTVGRFRQFVAAWNGGAGYTPPGGSGKHLHLNGGQGLTSSGSGGIYETGWMTSDACNVAPTNANLANPGATGSACTWTNTAGSQENLPINFVNWWEAYAFCIWDGGFLPTEAEWEFAAAGGSRQLEYPWGSMTPGTSNQYAVYGSYYANGPGALGSALWHIAPVGTAASGAGVWGQLDLVGELSEWTLDSAAPYADPCADCADLTPASCRAFRGGSFYDGAFNLVPPARDGCASPASRSDSVGFRCARTP
jgi:sulfatase modifying factor 1